MTIDVAALRARFVGAVPAVLCTAAADGTPNVTYLSRVHEVDAERIAISNQFFSKTARNLAENPRASLLLVEPATHDEYRLELRYERTERRGPVFEHLRADVDQIAALTGMQDVFHLRAADVYRVLGVTALERGHPPVVGWEGPPTPTPTVGGVGELCARLSRCGDLDGLVGAAVDGLAQVLGYDHATLLLRDEDGERLYTIASHGYPVQGVGSEVPLGQGVIGMAAVHGAAVRVGNLRQMQKYADTVRRSFEDEGIGPGRTIPVPGLERANSRLAVPAVAMGEVVGVLVVEDTRSGRYGPDDEAALTAVASVLGASLEHVRATETAGAPSLAAPVAAVPPVSEARTLVRYFPVDGSTFLDGDYLIKGVAGRILWSLLAQHQAEGRVEFTNRELRRDPTLDLPEFRANLESRLILLKRRLDERGAPVRIEGTGRGRFRLEVAAALHLQAVEPTR